MSDKSASENSVRLAEFQRIAADVAHDLNNLLFLISGYTEMLTKSLDNTELLIQTIAKIQGVTSEVRMLTERLQAMGFVENETSQTDPELEEREELGDRIERRGAKLVVAVGNKETNQLVTRILDRRGLQTKVVTDTKTMSTSSLDGWGSIDLLVIDDEAVRVERGVFFARLLREYPSSPILHLVQHLGDVPDLKIQRRSLTINVPFRPSDLVRKVNQLLA